MHKYLVELYLNDENGHPKGRDEFQYFDSECKYIAVENPDDIFARVRG